MLAVAQQSVSYEEGQEAYYHPQDHSQNTETPQNLYEMEQLQLNQKRQQSYYNPTAHDLPALNSQNKVICARQT